MRRKWIVQWLLILLAMPILAFNVWCGVNIHNLSTKRLQLKNDYARANDILYGLLSVTVWRDNLQKIANDRIQDFTFTKEQEEALKEQISKVLNAVIVEADSIIERDDNDFNGKLRKLAVHTFVNWNDVRKKVPDFSQTIYNEINKQENRDKIKKLVIGKIDEYAAMTRDSTVDTLQLARLLSKYKASNVDEFNSKISGTIDSLQYETYIWAFYMVGSLAFFLLLWFLLFKTETAHKPLFILSLILALIVLLVALTSPMIEIDARIKKLDFLLLGEHLQFHDQVIFYQSKSILDVVRILIGTKKIDSVIVGLLILVFSVLFPITKLLCTEIYLMGREKIRKSKVIQFFAFKSAKWSMADVMVVAIFMAYVGFKGILDNQLQNMNVKTSSVTSIATNLTALQPGFVLFLSFIIFSLFLSEILKHILRLKETFRIEKKKD